MTTKNINPNFFLVKIAKEDKKKKKMSDGLLHLSPNFIFGTRSMQCAEIVSIGKMAHLVMPMAKVGGTLVFSWKVEFAGEDEDGNENINMALVEQDNLFNYYTVTISEYKGRQSETFAYFDGQTITTHPSYVILKEVKEDTNKVIESKSGLFLFHNYKMSVSELQQKIDSNIKKIYSIANSVYSFERETSEAIERLENENLRLSEEMQGKEKYEKYTVSYSNPLLDFQDNDTVYAWNIMCLEKVEINNIEYIVTLAKHVGMKLPQSI
jgi:hypothetical protein